jgi:hypothetical protein
MDIKYTNIVHYQTLENLPKMGFLVWKNTIWQPCPRSRRKWSGKPLK